MVCGPQGLAWCECGSWRRGDGIGTGGPQVGAPCISTTHRRQAPLGAALHVAQCGNVNSGASQGRQKCLALVGFNVSSVNFKRNHSEYLNFMFFVSFVAQLFKLCLHRTAGATDKSSFHLRPETSLVNEIQVAPQAASGFGQGSGSLTTVPLRRSWLLLLHGHSG